MTDISIQLMDLGEYLGTDAVKFIKVRAFFEDIERIALTPYHKQQLQALELLEALEQVFDAVKKSGDASL